MNPVAEIITIGDEILIGQTIDTNSAWIGERMSLAGIPVKRILSISDDPAEIRDVLADCMKRAVIVLITGGLGPTSDDRTKQTLASFFGSELIESQEVMADLAVLFNAWNRQINDINRAQALVPGNCRVLRNPVGTAPGMWFEKDGCIVISMPGVPYEMKAIMETSVLPDLAGRFKVPAILHRTVMTTGVSESKLAEQLSGWERDLPAGFSLAYLPSPGMVKLRITGTGTSADQVAAVMSGLSETLEFELGSSVYGINEISLEETVGALLAQGGYTLATAESCTGGGIAHLMTNVAGSSGYFLGGVVAYANAVKIDFLDVPSRLIEEFGAVSKPVVEAMAEGCRKRFGSDFAVSVSGIAGPGGGTQEKPVGTIWVAVAGPAGIVSDCFHFGNQRDRNRIRAVLAGLNMVRMEVLKLAIAP
jgi:nicotinamide-nucleotide amidase